MNRIGIRLGIFLVMLIAMVGSASAANCGAGTAKPVCECGDTVIGDFTFTADLTCPNTGDGLIIGANNIVIDGAGYKMTGAESNCLCYIEGMTDEQTPAPHCGIRNNGNYDNVVIKNLEIENFCTGIALGDSSHISVDNNTVTDCYIHHNGNDTGCGEGGDVVTHGIHIVAANNCTITKNEITYNEGTGDQCGGGGNGIFMFGKTNTRGNDNTFTCNNLSYNAKSGFFMKMMCMHNTICNNIAIGNPEGGIVLMCKKSNYNTIERNNVSENTYGIYIGGRNNTVRYNTANDNRYFGINLPRSDGSYNNVLYENTVCGNGVADIRTCGEDCYGNHGNNNTCNTTSNYNDTGTTGCTYDCGTTDVGCAASDGTLFRCGDTVTKSCTFNGDMTCQTTGCGLVIGADNITIDGAGYTITGSATPDDCEWASETNPCTVSGIYNAGYDNVVIKDLEIEGFCTGIALAGSGGNKVRNNTIEGCSIHDNGFNTISSGGSEMITHGIHACWIDAGAGGEPALTIKENDIYDNEGTGAACGDGGNGIFIYAGSPESKHEKVVISCNKLYGNAKSGFWTKMMLSQSNITHNKVWGNGNGSGITDDVRGGIVLRCKKSNENLIAYNDVHDHAADGYGYGIYVGGSNNTIEYNNVTNNSKHGISMARSDGSWDNELYNNVVCDNGIDIREF